MKDELHIGVTGSRFGMSKHQKITFKKFINEKTAPEIAALHHGDCVGADAECHDIAVKLNICTHSHPPIRDQYRAYKGSDKIYAPREYLARDRDIVDMSKVLFAFPNSEYESPRSGTWYTVRYARKKQILVVMVLPDGYVNPDIEERFLEERW